MALKKIDYTVGLGKCHLRLGTVELKQTVAYVQQAFSDEKHLRGKDMFRLWVASLNRLRVPMQ